MKRISLHGGHSGQFCDHARDTLAEIVAAYHSSGFECVGLTEHMPPLSDEWLYPDEVELGRTAAWMLERFARYVAEARRLEREYAGRMRILVGMEGEWYPGCGSWVAELRDRFALDYVVGSVHHVGGICFDFSKEEYARAAQLAGGIVPMYAAYFDAQLEMMQVIQPEVVGHLDLIRIHDAEYPARFESPAIWGKAVRNLDWIRGEGLILDINTRPLLKGQAEPYPYALLLRQAAAMGISVSFGDDSHGVHDVATGVEAVDGVLAECMLRKAQCPSSQARQGGCCRGFPGVPQ